MPNVDHESYETETVKTEVIPITEEVKEPPVKKRGRPKQATTEVKKPVKKRKARPYGELIQAAVKGMTDKEKEILIQALKDEITGDKMQIESLKNNCEKAYAQARELEDQYKAMEAHYRVKLQYIDEQTSAFLKAVRLSTRGGLN